jgi:hypothetical protein
MSSRTVNATEDKSYSGVREGNKPTATSHSRKRISSVATIFTPKSAHKKYGIRDKLAGVETKLRNGTSEVRIPAQKINLFSSSKCPECLQGFPSLLCSGYGGTTRAVEWTEGWELTTHLHLMTRLRITGVIPLLPQCVFMVWVGTDVLFTQQEFVHLRKYFCIVLVYLPCFPNDGHLILYILRTRSDVSALHIGLLVLEDEDTLGNECPVTKHNFPEEGCS